VKVFSAMASDWLVDLAEAGAVVPNDENSVVIGAAVGTRRLYDFVQDSQVAVRDIAGLKSPSIAGGIPNFLAINSALQVDTSGQVNAEIIGRRYVGGIGGQADFARAAQLSDGGMSIFALPATASGGAVSRIIERVEGGIVTTTRSSVDVVVTEFGVADLRGKTLAERSVAMAAIAAPQFRSDLM
jgi:acyl-CoA hydrolase